MILNYIKNMLEVSHYDISYVVKMNEKLIKINYLL